MIAALLPLLGLGVPKWLSGPLKWLVDAAVIAALLLGLWALHGHWERKAYNAAYNQGWTVEYNQHLITLRSLDTALGIIKAKNAESDARAKAFQDAKAADAKAIADMDRRYASTDARRKALEAISRVPGGNVACRVPRAVTGALEGL